MRISDWSSDVCSSDLERDVEQIGRHAAHGEIAPLTLIVGDTEAGQATKRFSHILIGKAPNIVRAHLADLPGRLAFGLARGAIRGSPAGDDDARRRSAIPTFVGQLFLRHPRLGSTPRRAHPTRSAPPPPPVAPT